MNEQISCEIGRREHLSVGLRPRGLAPTRGGIQKIVAPVPEPRREPFTILHKRGYDAETPPGAGRDYW